MTMIIEIGTLTVTEARDVSIPQEFAAWHQTVRVQPGVYPVMAAVVLSDGVRRIVQAWARATGTTVSANYRSHFGGVPFGDDARGKALVGKPADVSIPVATYGAAPAGLTLRADRAVFGARLELAAGAKLVVVEGNSSGAPCPAVVAGTLDRAAQIALAARTIERARAAGYWDTWTMERDIQAVAGLIDQADVRARFAAALPEKFAARAA